MADCYGLAVKRWSTVMALLNVIVWPSTCKLYTGSSKGRMFWLPYEVVITGLLTFPGSVIVMWPVFSNTRTCFFFNVERHTLDNFCTLKTKTHAACVFYNLLGMLEKNHRMPVSSIVLGSGAWQPVFFQCVLGSGSWE